MQALVSCLAFKYLRTPSVYPSYTLLVPSLNPPYTLLTLFRYYKGNYSMFKKMEQQKRRERIKDYEKQEKRLNI